MVAVRDAYWRNLALLAPRLPPNVHKLATEVNLHDALIVQFLVSRGCSELRTRYVCGDLQTGYLDLVLVYSGVLMAKLNTVLLKEIADDPSSEALYDEIDTGETGIFAHSVLFRPYREIKIIFEDVAIHSRALANRGRPKVEKAFIQS